MNSFTLPAIAFRHLQADSTSMHPSSYDSTVSSVHNASGANQSRAHQQVEYYKDAQIGFLVTLLLLIVLGNAVVLAAITLSRERRRSRMNFFIMHLAVCDLLTGPLVVLADLIQKLTTYWYAGDTMCRLHKFTQVTVTYASTYMLVALSVDRLDAVARPMRFSSSRLKAKVLVTTAWVLSVVFAVPQLVLFRVGIQFGGPMCMIDFTQSWQWQAYLTPIAVTLFIIPAIIICICYVIIIAVIWRSSHLLQRNNGISIRGKHREEEPLNGRCSPFRQHQQPAGSSCRGIIPQAKIRTIKMTFIIVLVFIVCWSPYFIFNLCQVYGGLPDTTHINKWSTFIQSMAPLNSAANPIIYGIFSTRICKYLRRVYVCGRLGQQVRQWWRDGRGTRGGGSSSGSRPQSPGPSTPTDCSSLTDADHFILLSAGQDPQHHYNHHQHKHQHHPTPARVPYVQQSLSEADKALLFLHLKNKCEVGV